MKLDIMPIQGMILKRLSAAAEAGEIDEVTRLSAMAAKTKELQIAADRIQSELAEIQRSLDSPSQKEEADEPDEISDTRSRGANSTVEITIDWSKNGQPFGVETISESFGSATMAKLIERLSQILGSRVLDAASKIRVNRGPLVSKNPQRDYWNNAAKKPYSHHKINGTGFFVLTGTSSDQKVTDATTLLRMLGLVAGSYAVRKLARE